MNATERKTAAEVLIPRIACPHCHGLDVVNGPYVEVGYLLVLREYWCESCHRTFTPQPRATRDAV